MILFLLFINKNLKKLLCIFHFVSCRDSILFAMAMKRHIRVVEQIVQCFFLNPTIYIRTVWEEINLSELHSLSLS